MAVLKEVAALPNAVIESLDKVVETGLNEKIEFSVTLFGRKYGVRTEIWLMSSAPKEGN